MVLKKIFLTGGSGILGTELIKISSDYGVEFVAPRSWECDITEDTSVFWSLTKNQDCDLVIHCAAETDVKKMQEEPFKGCKVNVCGTLNLLKYCDYYNKKLIFISTEHVFDGLKGLYSTNDRINPLSNYAKSKAAAEMLVKMYKNSLIIRTSFFGYEFPYQKAFIDQWSSKDYIDIIAPKVLEAAISDKCGTVHVGSERRTIYEIATKRKPLVEKISLKDALFSPIPVDTSLRLGHDNE